MSWKAACALILCIFFGCRQQHERLKGDQPAELVGTWQLLVRSSCDQYGVKSDMMILHPDGTFDQYVTMNDNKHYQAKAQHWNYMPMEETDDSIVLHNRLEFFTPELYHTPIGTPVSQGEVLILEGGSDPLIVLHPHWDCVYVKERQP